MDKKHSKHRYKWKYLLFLFNRRNTRSVCPYFAFGVGRSSRLNSLAFAPSEVTFIRSDWARCLHDNNTKRLDWRYCKLKKKTWRSPGAFERRWSSCCCRFGADVSPRVPARGVPFPTVVVCVILLSSRCYAQTRQRHCVVYRRSILFDTLNYASCRVPEDDAPPTSLPPRFDDNPPWAVFVLFRSVSTGKMVNSGSVCIHFDCF